MLVFVLVLVGYFICIQDKKYNSLSAKCRA